MTKERLTFTLSKELNEAIAFLATAKQMSLSEFLGTRLYWVPEIKQQIERFQNLPEDPITKIEGAEKITPDTPTRIFPKESIKQNEKKLLAQ